LHREVEPDVSIALKIFDEAQAYVYKFMKNESYSRFIRTKEFLETTLKMLSNRKQTETKEGKRFLTKRSSAHNLGPVVMEAVNKANSIMEGNVVRVGASSQMVVGETPREAKDRFFGKSSAPPTAISSPTPSFPPTSPSFSPLHKDHITLSQLP
jgi:hypothetical protein